jgi:DNA-directed RNA polymerase subunit RPC12/RpoP
MNELKFNCSHCDQHLQCDPQFSGREIQCPHCNVLIRIPSIPGNTANYQPEVGQTWATHVGPGHEQPPSNLRLSRKPGANEPDKPCPLAKKVQGGFFRRRDFFKLHDPFCS